MPAAARPRSYWRCAAAAPVLRRASSPGQRPIRACAGPRRPHGPAGRQYRQGVRGLPEPVPAAALRRQAREQAGYPARVRPDTGFPDAVRKSIPF